MNISNLKDKVVLITGASSGIGRSTSIELAKLEAKLIISGRSEEKLNELGKELSALGATYLIIAADLLSLDAAVKIVKQSVEWGRGLDAIVSCAGGGRFTYFSRIDKQTFDDSIRLNMLAPIEIIREALPHLTKSEESIIVFVNTIAAREPSMPKASAYLAGKSGLIHFAESLFAEIRDQGVKVTSIMPDLTDTPLVPEELGIDRSSMIDPVSVAKSICFVMSMTRDACITELHIRPQPSLRMN
jgi:short-subunit dehydrogenase